MILSYLAACARATVKACGLALVVAAVAAPSLATDSHPVPEMDPASLGSALTCLTGGAMILASRWRRRK